MRALSWLLALAALAGCDPRMKSSGGATQASVVTAPSEADESCAATSDCKEGLRCVDGSCLPPKSSRLGDYYWAAGDLNVKNKDVVAAVTSYQQALGQFDAEKLPAPAGLLCAAGHALRLNAKDAKAPEQAARLLHRCVLTARPGSNEYRLGMAELAELEALGLDPWDPLESTCRHASLSIL